MSIREYATPAEKRVDPRVKRTRGLIMRAFEELVTEKGPRGLTVQEIAERATINRATFYAHFRDQYELFDVFMREFFRDELQRKLPEDPGLDEETLKALILATGDFLAVLESGCRPSDRPFTPRIEGHVPDELQKLLLAWIEAGAQENNGRPARPENTAPVVAWAIFGAGLRCAHAGATESAEEIAEQALSVIVGGLRY